MTVNVGRGQIHIGWQAAASVLIFTVSTTWAISAGLHNINESVQSVRTEMHTAIDSIKNKQQTRSFESDLHFQRIEAKLDMLSLSSNIKK